MKKLFVTILSFTLAAIWVFGSAAEKTTSLELELIADLHTWDPIGISAKDLGWVQGLAVWKSFAFVCHDGGICVIYDIKKNKYVNHFQLPGQKSHCNNAMFGWEKYNSSSEFPLLYVSDCVDCGKCYVYDITTQGAVLVQTIHLKEKPGGENGGNGWYCDFDRKTLCTHWAGRYWEHLIMPDKRETDPIISIEGIVADGEMDLPATHQGACRFKGKTYFPCGFDSDPYITVKENESSKNISLLEIGTEPEGICGYGNYVYVTFCKDYHPLLYRFRVRCH